MNISCPVQKKDGRCDGELEVELVETDDGDGVWAQSGWSVMMPLDKDSNVFCSEGCKLNEAQVKQVEDKALEPYDAY